ncbi:MAG TPA: YdcF family protein [Rhodocyclaceae bacterium]|nr:YdcF family protein [Rhodocyclaceae bacterium]
MFILKKFIVAAILPPFGPLLLILAGLWMMRRWPRFGRTLTFGALFLLMLMSLPLVEIRLQRLAETSPPLPYLPQQTLQALAGAQAIVVLGGGTYPAAAEYGGDTVSRNTLLRIRYAARLQRISGLPLLVSGGAPFGSRPEALSMREALTEDFSVPVRWIEDASLDTAQNAEFSARLLKQSGIGRIALVTGAEHMARAADLFQRQGLTVIAAPTGFANDSPSLIENLLPDSEVLARSQAVLHEWLGRIWNAH